jgi:hypothetical protein
MTHKGFTQGQWEDDNTREYYQRRVIRMNGVVVAIMASPSGNSPSQDEVDANARLLADAPALLAERDRLLALLERVLDTPSLTPAWDTVSLAIRAALAATKG